MSYPETTTMATPYTFNLPSMDGLDFGNDDLADDMEGLTLSFPKVKIPAGGSLQFELPTGDPENPEYVRFLQGVILFHHASGAYWPEGMEYDDNTVPLCSTARICVFCISCRTVTISPCSSLCRLPACGRSMIS